MYVRFRENVIRLKLALYKPSRHDRHHTKLFPNTTIGYVEDEDGGSDHAAWWPLGFETSMAFESSHKNTTPAAIP
jgi:hypothetical protein